MLDTGEHLSALAADSEAFADRIGAKLDAPVPACPEWSVRDLIAHLGAVYSWATMVVNEGGGRPTGHRNKLPEGADPEAVDRWFRERRHEVLHTLESKEPNRPAWMFYPPHCADVGWWRRRQAHETAVHLFDLQAASGKTPSTIDPEFAADGVDEMLSDFLPPFLEATPIESFTGTLHVHCTDTEGEWSLDFAGRTIRVDRTHTKADTALRGPAAGLYLWLWNRQSITEAGLEAFGDQAILDAWPQVQI